MKNLPMNSNSKYKQNIIEVSSNDGYNGQKKIIRIMSSYEMKAVKIIKQLFLLNRIIGFTSEETIIPYINTIKENGDDINKIHRYYMDFTLETEDKIIFVEVKPKTQTIMPKLKRNATQKQINNYHKQMKDFIKNNDKWLATQKYCDSLNAKNPEKTFIFQIWTEKELNI